LSFIAELEEVAVEPLAKLLRPRLPTMWLNFLIFLRRSEGPVAQPNQMWPGKQLPVLVIETN
jgi:hypothetical protein